MSESIVERLEELRAAIDRARLTAGRTDPVTLVAVSKTMSVDVIQQAYDAGHRTFGENRVQEARSKVASTTLSMPHACWHLIGTLQSNKARAAVQTFGLIECVDSLRIATVLNRLAVEGLATVPVLLEVNIGGEASKGGFTPDVLLAELGQLLTLEGIHIRGLMTVAPQAENPEQVRPVFAALRLLLERIREQPNADTMDQLSMGMSGDFRVAIEEGATIVRIGRALFGARPLPARTA